MLGLYSYIAILSGQVLTTLKWPSAALAAVLIMFSLEQWGQATTTVVLQHRTLTNYAVGIIVLLGLACRLARGKQVLTRLPRVAWIVFALLGYAYISTLWSPSNQSADLWAHQLPYMVVMLVLAPLLVVDVEDFNAVFSALLFFGFALVVLLLFFVEWDNRRIVIRSGISTLYGNPLEIATLAAGVLMVAMFHVQPIFRNLWFILRWVVVALCLALIVTSGSRGQLVGVIAAIVLLWPLNYRFENPFHFLGWLLGVVILVSLVGWAISEYGQQNIRWGEERIAQDVSGRFENSLVLLENWELSPLAIVFGLGNSASYNLLGIYPHNVPVEVLGEEGIFGFVLYVWILTLSGRSIVRVIRCTAAGCMERRMLSILVGYGLFAFIVSLKQGSLITNLPYLMFVILLGRFEIAVSQRFALADVARPHPQTLRRRFLTETRYGSQKPWK